MNADIEKLFVAIERQVKDPRKPRGIRHPALAIIKLVLIGLMCRLTSVEPICTLAQQQWHQLKTALGFTRDNPPHPTTVTRLLGQIQTDQLSTVFRQWMACDLSDSHLVASVDGKTANNAKNEQGKVVMMVNLFAHDLKQTLAGFPVPAKSGEPKVLAKHLSSLFESYPGLQLLIGDAYYAGRTMCQSIVDLQRHYLVAVKKNAGELYDAIELEFAHQQDINPLVEEVEKKKGQ